jgi:hypothetical protein
MLINEHNLDLLSHLPDEVVIRIVANMRRQHTERFLASTDYTSVNSLIGGSFSWDRTPEGQEYWSRLYDRY